MQRKKTRSLMQNEFWHWRWPIVSVNIRDRSIAGAAIMGRSTRIAAQAFTAFWFDFERVEAVAKRQVGGINIAGGMRMGLGSTKLFVDSPHSTNEALEIERALFVCITFIPEDSSVRTAKRQAQRTHQISTNLRFSIPDRDHIDLIILPSRRSFGPTLSSTWGRLGSLFFPLASWSSSGVAVMRSTDNPRQPAACLPRFASAWASRRGSFARMAATRRRWMILALNTAP